MKRRKKKLSTITGSQSKKEDLLRELKNKLNLRVEEARTISERLESTDLSDTERNELYEKLNTLKSSIQYYEDEIPRVELYGTHNFSSNKQKRRSNMPKQKKKRPWIHIIYTPMGNKR